MTSFINNAEADSIFADATSVCQNIDGLGDVECDVAFERVGGVTVFSAGDGSIDSGVEFNAVVGLPGNVKVVNQINWCSGNLIPNVIGCAQLPGDSFAVVRIDSALEGILWAHEYGHNKGLFHRLDTRAVMNPVITSAHTHLNAAECTALRN